jgi:hypothetical protein
METQHKYDVKMEQCGVLLKFNLLLITVLI